MAQVDGEFFARESPRSFPVSVIIECTPSRSAWASEQWRAVGLAVGDQVGDAVRKIFDEQGVRRYQHPGYRVTLHVDECESYYFNLLSERPQCYVVADVEPDAPPLPRLVSVSFDEAHAYLEGEQEVYTVDMPPELYRWVESFVLTHYVMEPRKKRKRTDWTPRS